VATTAQPATDTATPPISMTPTAAKSPRLSVGEIVAIAIGAPIVIGVIVVIAVVVVKDRRRKGTGYQTLGPMSLLTAGEEPEVPDGST
jgi:heme/copper-type cytochrome/quinol oxidase subunit 2